jgi:UDP-glucuronate 4-epimerase
LPVRREIAGTGDDGHNGTVSAEAPAAPETFQSLRGARVVVTGVTGQVAEPLAVALAADNEVFGAARFSNPDAARRLRRAGVQCVQVDLASGDVRSLPSEVDYVVHMAVSKTNDWDTDLAVNSGGLASLMEHLRDARAFLHCSSTAVYRPRGHHRFVEGDALGDNHGVWPFLRTYSIAKIAAEATARWASRRYELPTTIARLCVPYGDNGGWPAWHLEMMIRGVEVPVHIDAPSIYHPLHQDDVVASVPGLLRAASTPATVLNWGGEEASIEDWCTWMADLCGLEARFSPTDQTIDSVRLDLTRLHRLVGGPTVPWREGIRRMVAARHPELL